MLLEGAGSSHRGTLLGAPDLPSCPGAVLGHGARRRGRARPLCSAWRTVAPRFLLFEYECPGAIFTAGPPVVQGVHWERHLERRTSADRNRRVAHGGAATSPRTNEAVLADSSLPFLLPASAWPTLAAARPTRTSSRGRRGAARQSCRAIYRASTTMRAVLDVIFETCRTGSSPAASSGRAINLRAVRNLRWPPVAVVENQPHGARRSIDAECRGPGGARHQVADSFHCHSFFYSSRTPRHAVPVDRVRSARGARAPAQACFSSQPRHPL